MHAAIEQSRGGDWTRAAFWLAWSWAALSVALFAAGVLLYLLSGPASLSGTVSELLGGAPFLIFPLVGALIAARRPDNPIGWILLADGLLWMLIITMEYYTDLGVARPGSVPLVVAVGTINNWLWVPFVGLLGTFVFLLFPDGRLPSRRWRPLAFLSGATMISVSIMVAITPGPLQGLGGIRNPLGVLARPWMEKVPIVLVPLFLLCMAASVLSLVLRYRRSKGEERQQLKWIALAASVVGLLYVLAMIGSFVYPQETWFAQGSPLWLLVLENAALLSFILIPLAVGVAMLRYRLYDVDLVINRALVYGPLTATLAAVYFGGVVGTQAAFRSLTGQEQQPQLAVVVSTLAIAALFNPLRRRIQSLIDRRFYRRKYDARKTLEAFSARLREETDLDDLTEDLVGMVRETMQPQHASLWLRSSSKTGTSEDPSP